MTGGLRTGDSKKIESIRINLRDLARSQVFPRDPGLLPPWNPGTRPGTTPGIPSKHRTAVSRCLFIINGERLTVKFIMNQESERFANAMGECEY